MRRERRRGFTLVELLIVVATIGVLALLLLPAAARAKTAAKSAVCKSNLRQIGFGLNLYVEDFDSFPGSPPHTAENQTIGQWYVVAGQIRERGIVQITPYVSAGRIDSEGSYVGRPHNSVLVCPAREKARFNFGGTLDMAETSGGITWGIMKNGPRPFGYGYNSLGSVWRPPLTSPLGLAPIYKNSEYHRVKTSNVRTPAAMLAFADSIGEFGENVTPYEGGIQPIGLPDRHQKGANAVFVDGHVQYKLRSHWTQPTPSARQIWNNDHEPHPETW